MARPKKIIARTKVRDNQDQICLFRRKKNHELSFLEILVEDAPSNSSLANSIMNNLSQKLKISWHKKLLKIDITKRLLIRERRKARKEAQRKATLLARAKKPPLLTFDGSSKIYTSAEIHPDTTPGLIYQRGVTEGLSDQTKNLV